MQCGVVAYGFFAAALLVYLIIKVTRANLGEGTSPVVGMIVGEVTCIVATLLFATSSLLKMSNEIGFIAAIFLRLVIFTVPVLMTSRWVFWFQKVRNEHKDALKWRQMIQVQVSEAQRRLESMESTLRDG